MSKQKYQLLWTQQDWLAEAHKWISHTLSQQKFALTGEIEQIRARIWSTILRVPTDQGNLFFKAAIPGMSHEMSSLPRLAQWRPDCFPEVLATDTEQGWILMTDAGTSLRSIVNGIEDFNHYHDVLRLYAGLQMELINHVPELLALGVPDQRESALTSLYEQLLSDNRLVRVGKLGGLTEDQYQELCNLIPQVQERCDQLASYGIPASIEHSDFHDNNIFVQNEKYIILDWGDSSIAHPFMSLLVMLRSIAYHQLEADDPELLKLRDTYLNMWADHGEPDTLLEALTLAQQLGMICRMMTWKHVITAYPDYKGEHVNAVAGWMLEFRDSF